MLTYFTSNHENYERNSFYVFVYMLGVGWGWRLKIEHINFAQVKPEKKNFKSYKANP